MMTRRILAAFTLGAMALGPAACSSEPEQPVQEELTADPAAPEGISVEEGRLTLPAVSGNPGAVYFTLGNSGDADMAIRSVSVEGAGMAMMHETMEESGMARMQDVAQVPVPAGETVSFEPGGLHVMAMDLDEALEIGEVTEVTLTFASGDKISFPAAIRAPGDAS